VNAGSRWIYLFAAAALHAAVLWGIRIGAISGAILDEPGEGEPMEVGLVESAEPAALEPAPEPVQPVTPPPPPTPVPPPPVEPPPPPPPPDALPDPEPAPAPPPVAPTPPPKPVAKPKAKSAAKAAGSPQKGSSSSASSANGKPGAGSGVAGPGDTAHATRVRRVDPVYPRALQAAGITGHVVLLLNINALGQLTGVRVEKSSGHPELDQAAIAAARASTYKPKRIGGLPLPDSIPAPYNFVKRRP
jgi:protein TonB